MIVSTSIGAGGAVTGSGAANQIAVWTGSASIGGYAALTYNNATFVESLAASNSGGAVTRVVSNTSNTASSDALFQIKVAGTSGGDPYINFSVTGSTQWAVGIDQSNSRKLVISQASTLGTNDFLTVDPAGITIFANGTQQTGKVDAGGDWWFGKVNDTTQAMRSYGSFMFLNIGGVAATEVNFVNGALDGFAGFGGDGAGVKLAGGGMLAYGRNHATLPSYTKFGAGGATLWMDVNANVVMGNGGQLSTSATDGFLYLDSCNGIPSGTPTAFSGRNPIIIDTATGTGKLWVYIGAAWRGVALT